MRKKVLMGLGLLLCLLYGTSPVYGFWQEKIDSETRIHKLSCSIGRWMVVNPELVDIVEFEPNHPPEKTIKKGSLVVYRNPDGSSTV